MPTPILTPEMRLVLSEINSGGELRLSELGGGEVRVTYKNHVHPTDWETFGRLLALGLISPVNRRGNTYAMTDAGRRALGEPG